MKEYTKKQRITAYAILALIIIVQIIYTTFTFVYKKEGYHSDEVWSYGLANSYYKPFIHMKSGIANSIVTHEAYTEEAYDNNNKWISGKVFKDYLTVQQDERFSYGSVIYNQTLDNHPPLYYCLIHTISSLFPDRFSFIYGYILNCIFLIVTQIFLYKLCLLVLKNKNIYIPLVVCGLYAFGIGSVSTFIFIRIYAMLAMLITMHMYFQLKYIEYPDKSLKKLLPPVLITAFVGFMTEYLFIAAAGICTACICLIMLFRKQIKKMFIWGLSMLATLIVFFTLYSSALNQIGGYELTTSFTPYEQF
ncbi:MAG: hypothetical protein Q4E74_11900, partial [Ruminococcus sp.]|nr:hypothetical protein [Ruminococcus sp.]